MTQDTSSPPAKPPKSTPPSKETACADAASDWIAAWPPEPQQLFLLLPADAAHAGWRELAQSLSQTFAQGAVAILALPAEIAQAEKSRQPAAVAALRQLVQHWQARAGLDFARTALIAQGQAASVAIQAVMQHADMCARLFALGGSLPQQAMPISEHTSLHCLHEQDDASVSAGQARELGQRLQMLDADFTLDVLPGDGATVCSPAMQQRVLHLLQNHVPRRLWREALASAGLDEALQATDGSHSVRH